MNRSEKDYLNCDEWKFETGGIACIQRTGIISMNYLR